MTTQPNPAPMSAIDWRKLFGEKRGREIEQLIESALSPR